MEIPNFAAAGQLTQIRFSLLDSIAPKGDWLRIKAFSSETSSDATEVLGIDADQKQQGDDPPLKR